MYFLYNWLVALFPLMSRASLVITTTTKISLPFNPFRFWVSIADSIAHTCRFSTQIKKYKYDYATNSPDNTYWSLNSFTFFYTRSRTYAGNHVVKFPQRKTFPLDLVQCHHFFRLYCFECLALQLRLVPIVWMDQHCSISMNQNCKYLPWNKYLEYVYFRNWNKQIYQILKYLWNNKSKRGKSITDNLYKSWSW